MNETIASTVVNKARDKHRPQGRLYIMQIIDGFLEMHGDRRCGDDPAVVGGIGYLGDRPVTVISTDKGRLLNERLTCSFGMPHPEGYRKAMRLMEQAAKFKRPIICFVDTPGAHCGIEAEERGQGQAIAESLALMGRLPVPIITIITGEGGSGGALALGVCDSLVMLENTIFSVISPEGCASILFKDASRSKEAAEMLKLTAKELYDLKLCDLVIPEPPKLNRHTMAPLTRTLKITLTEKLDELCALTPEELLEKRYHKYRRIGRLT